MKLYVKDAVREPNDTLYTFLYKILRMDTNLKKSTVNTTYLDPEFKDQQCIANKYRSFGAILKPSFIYKILENADNIFCSAVISRLK